MPNADRIVPLLAPLMRKLMPAMMTGRQRQFAAQPRTPGRVVFLGDSITHDAGGRLLIVGPGTIGLLAAMFATAMGVEVHLLGVPGASTEFARTFPVTGVWTHDDLPGLSFDAIVDASFGPDIPARAVDLVEPGKRVVLMGLAGSPSTVDTRTIALRELTVQGLLGAGDAIPGTIDVYASAGIEARRLVAATLPLEQATAVLSGNRPPGAGPGPKVHFDPKVGS